MFVHYFPEIARDINKYFSVFKFFVKDKVEIKEINKHNGRFKDLFMQRNGEEVSKIVFRLSTSKIEAIGWKKVVRRWVNNRSSPNIINK